MDVRITYNDKVFKKLGQVNDKTMYAVARKMVDLIGEMHATAYKTGATEDSMFTNGVNGVAQDDKGYYIGNFTRYAERVYKLNKANWTNPQTRPHWFQSVWREYGEIITRECMARYLND